MAAALSQKEAGIFQIGQAHGLPLIVQLSLAGQRFQHTVAHKQRRRDPYRQPHTVTSCRGGR